MVESGIRGLNACHDKVESGYKYNEISICRSVYTSMDLRRDRILGKCLKPKDTHKPRMQKREKPSQREVYHCADWSIPESG